MLVAFLVLILVALATFTRVETQVAANSQNLAQARQNALFALNVALGELQRSAGPDQRITATATIGENNSSRPDRAATGLVTPLAGSRHWTGVWGGYRDDKYFIHRPAFLNWLVSGNESTTFEFDTTPATFGEITRSPNGITPPVSIQVNGAAEPVPASTRPPSFTPASVTAAEATALTTGAQATDAFTIAGTAAALLVGPNTLGASASVNDYVLAPIVSLRSTDVVGLDASAAPDPAGYEIGRYAWWVGDEGVKARANLVDSRATSNTGDDARLRTLVAPRSGVETTTGLAAYRQVPASGPSPERAVNLEQIGFVDGLAINDVKARFHDLTTHSVGVLADVARGGLKKDLTSGLLGATVPAGLGNSDELFASLLPSSLPGVRPDRLPTWGALRAYANIADDLGAPIASADANAPSITPRAAIDGSSGTDPRMAVHPVVLRKQLWVFPGVDADDTNVAGATITRVDALYLPAIVLWNPYDVTIRAQDYDVWFGTKGIPAGSAYPHASRFPALAVAVKNAVPAPANANAPFAKWYIGFGALEAAGFGLRISSDAIAPGEAIIFTLQDNHEVNPSLPASTPAQRILRPGFRRTFLKHTGVINIPAAEIGYRAQVSMSVPPSLVSDFELRLTGTGFGADGRPDGDLLQRVVGVRWDVGPPNTPTNTSAAVATYNTSNPTGTPPTPADNWEVSPANVPASEVIASGAVPAGTRYFHNTAANRSSSIRKTPDDNDELDIDAPSQNPAPQAESILAYGLYAKMDGSGIEAPSFATSPAVTIVQNNVLAGRWLANQDPTAPEIAVTANDNVSGALYNSAPLFGNGSQAVLVGNNGNSNNQLLQNYDNFYVAGVGDKAYVGMPVTAGNTPGTTRCILIHLPRNKEHILSLGLLQHARLHPVSGTLTDPGDAAQPGYTASAMPLYAIGNSLADPRVQPPGRLNNPRTRTTPVQLQGFADWDSLSANPLRANRRFHFDLSYLVNQVLWDTYYFSSFPTDGSTPLSPFALPNRRHLLHDPAGLAATAPNNLRATLRDHTRAARHLLVAGAFNANSTSVEAWKAVLASTLNAPVVRHDQTAAFAGTTDLAPFPRLVHPHDGPATASTLPGTTTAHAGFRALNEDQLGRLAAEIVHSVRRHGPFPSMARLVNRKPSATPEHGGNAFLEGVGPLQMAIDRSSTEANDNDVADSGSWTSTTPTQSRINDQHITMTSYAGAAAGYVADTTQPINFNTNAGLGRQNTPNGAVDADVPLSYFAPTFALPGYLTQADLLQVLGPILSVRSDTFRIRTYGEVRDPVNDTIIGRAWCEAIVQRLPDYVDQSDPALANPVVNPLGNAAAPADTNSTNQTFGRRLHVVGFRWLGPNDI